MNDHKKYDIETGEELIRDVRSHDHYLQGTQPYL